MNLFAILLFSCSLLWSSPTVVQLRLQSKAVQTIPTQGSGDSLRVDLLAAAQATGLSATWDILARRISLADSTGQMLHWFEDSPWVRWSDTTARLGGVAVRRNGTLWVPPADFSEALKRLNTAPLRWQSDSLLFSEQATGDIISFRLEKRANGDVFELRMSRRIPYESFFHRPHFLLRLQKATLDSAAWSQLPTGSLVRRIVPVQEAATAQITFQVNDRCEGVEIMERDEGRTLQIIFRTKINTPEPPTPTETKPKKIIRNIIIDPGHGGKDPGAVGSKFYEKDIVLGVGRKLRDKLRKAGLNPRMTRDDDTFVELQERPAMASRWEGDLFISLHCNAIDGNAARKRRTEGFKIFILRESESEEDKAIARRENKAIELSQGAKTRKAEISPVEWILLENQLNLYTRESERVASYMVDIMQGGSVRKLGTGAGQAGFLVLVGAYMPAVLVELGFITHPEDEVFLGSSKGQEQLAESLAKAVLKYKQSVEK